MRSRSVRGPRSTCCPPRAGTAAAGVAGAHCDRLRLLLSPRLPRTGWPTSRWTTTRWRSTLNHRPRQAARWSIPNLFRPPRIRAQPPTSGCGASWRQPTRRSSSCGRTSSSSARSRSPRSTPGVPRRATRSSSGPGWGWNRPSHRNKPGAPPTPCSPSRTWSIVASRRSTCPARWRRARHRRRRMQPTSKASSGVFGRRSTR